MAFKLEMYGHFSQGLSTHFKFCIIMIIFDTETLGIQSFKIMVMYNHHRESSHTAFKTQENCPFNCFWVNSTGSESYIATFPRVIVQNYLVKLASQSCLNMSSMRCIISFLNKANTISGLYILIESQNTGGIIYCEAHVKSPCQDNHEPPRSPIRSPTHPPKKKKKTCSTPVLNQNKVPLPEVSRPLILSSLNAASQ